MTTLRPGIITIFRGGAREPIVISGGFAEVGPGGLTVLADTASPLDSFDVTMLATEIKDAEEDAADATDPDQRDRIARRVDQLKALQAALAARGTSPH